VPITGNAAAAQENAPERTVADAPAVWFDASPFTVSPGVA